jgi:hypothetical protein
MHPYPLFIIMVLRQRTLWDHCHNRQLNHKDTTRTSIEHSKIIPQDGGAVRALVRAKNTRSCNSRNNAAREGSFNITNYVTHRCKCLKCQGIVTLIHNDTQAEVSAFETNDETDIQVVTVWKKTKSHWRSTMYIIHQAPS